MLKQGFYIQDKIQIESILKTFIRLSMLSKCKHTKISVQNAPSFENLGRTLERQLEIIEAILCRNTMHWQKQGARLVCSLGCVAFGPKLAPSKHVTKENSSLYVANLSLPLNTQLSLYSLFQLCSQTKSFHQYE